MPLAKSPPGAISERDWNALLEISQRVNSSLDVEVCADSDA